MIGELLILLSLICALVAYAVKKLRTVLAAIAMVVMGFGSGIYFSDHATVGGLLFLFFSLFQLLNIARLIEGRLHEKYLHNAFLKGGYKLLLLQLSSYGLDFLVRTFTHINIVVVLVWLQLAIAITISVTVLYRLYISRPLGVKNYLSDKELPSISVLIPARNEDTDLEELLRTIIANDYPKLEVLVLDDCSTGKNISEIVKKFAHDGVRFVQGVTPSENWLAKNQAYQTLYSHSSGEWLIFMGVDVRLGVGSLRALMHYALVHQKSMVSVMPRRFSQHFWPGFASPLRHFRELTKINFNRKIVPALSTLWLISRESFESHGCMDGVSRKIIPEDYFAAQLNKQKKYAFVRTNDYLQVSTSKKLSEQIKTSLRVIYPSLHRRMERSGVSIVFMFVGLVLPYILLLYSVVVGQGGTILILTLISCSLLTFTHALITSFTNPIIWPLALFNLPYVAFQEIILTFISMAKYEFGEIFWKGRNVCLPVMHVIPRLPKLKD